MNYEEMSDKKINGAVTCVRRRQSTKLKHKRILG